MADSNPIGRPTVMTPSVLDKLRQAFLIGATNLEAAGYAGITEKTLYNYLNKNPEYLQQIEAWKNEPILKSKTTVVKGLDDIKNAQWYLERKASDFKPKFEGDVNVHPLDKVLEGYGLPVGGIDATKDDEPDEGASSLPA